MADEFRGRRDDVFLPSRLPFAITPHDSNPLPTIPKRIYVGTGGNITLRGIDGVEDVVYKNVGSGVYLNVRPSLVKATGTTATDIIGEA